MVTNKKIVLWLRPCDKELFESIIPDVNLEKYSEDILKGLLEEPGYVAKIKKHFVLGRKKIWTPKDTEDKIAFVYIKNNSAYGNGLILTPYSDTDVIYHLKSKLIKRHHREELLGSDQDDFIKRVFETYESPLIDKFDERGHHLVLYEVTK